MDKGPIPRHYGTGHERTRLGERSARIEFARTKELLRRGDDPGRREHVLRAARSVEQEPTLLGLSAHLLAIARKNS